MLEAMHNPRVLTISTLYPSDFDPVYGIFIHRSVQTIRSRGIPSLVVSPVPYAPKILAYTSRWNKWVRIKNSGHFEGVPTLRPAYVEIPVPFFWPFHGISMASRLLPFLIKLKKSFDFNIIHSHTVTPDGLAGAILGKFFGLPTICSIRGCDINNYPFRSKIYYRFSRYVLENTNILLANNQVILEKARAIARNEIRTACIYNGVDKSLFFPVLEKGPLRRNLSLPRDKVLIVFIGGFMAAKGVSELVHAYGSLNRCEAETHLILIGDGPLLPEIKSRLAQDGLIQNVTITGRITQKLAADYLRSSDIFVLPSHTEGMPNALLEAMACGLAAIITPVGGVEEIVQDGQNGQLVPVGDVAQLRDTMLALTSNETLRSKMGQKALETTADRFSWTTNAVQHESLYRCLADCH